MYVYTYKYYYFHAQCLFIYIYYYVHYVQYMRTNGRKITKILDEGCDCKI